MRNGRGNTTKRSILATAILLSFFASRIAAADLYHAVNLGSLQGDYASTANCINKSGRVAGTAVFDGTVTHAYLTSAYSPITASSDLGTGQYARLGAYGVNDAGHVVGFVATGFAYSRYAAKNFGGGMTPLFENAFGSSANAINAADYIVGTYLSDSAVDRGFLYTPQGAMIDLATLGGTTCVPMGINKDNVIVGGSTTSANSQYHAFKTGPNSKVHPTDDLTPTAESSFAYGVNAAGIVVGEVDDGPGLYPQACRWVGAIQETLGSLGADRSAAYAINTSGVIVGEAWNANGKKRAFVCQPGGQMVDLNDLIGDPNWELQTARSINDSGAIVGEGLYFGEQRAFLLRPILPASFSISPGKIAGPLTATGKVTLNYPAPTNLVVKLSQRHIAADCPASVTVLAAKTFTTFPITTSVVTSNTPGTFSATYGGVTKTATLTVMPISVKTVAFSPSSVIGCKTGKGTISLEAPAAPGDITASLSSANTSLVEVPASVTVAAGATQATFLVTTHPVATSNVVGVTATANGRSKTGSVTVKPIPPKSLTVSPTKVVGGNAAVGTVTLECPAAPGNITVSLSSSHAAATVPPSVTVIAGATTATFPISTNHVLATTSVTIKGTANGVTKSATLTVVP